MEKSIELETDADGHAQMSSESVKTKGHKGVSEVEFVVVGVSAGGHAWDGWEGKVSIGAH